MSSLVGWLLVAMNGVVICKLMLERKSIGLIIVRKIESWNGTSLAATGIEN
jgi:hypothetical protein